VKKTRVFGVKGVKRIEDLFEVEQKDIHIHTHRQTLSYYREACARALNRIIEFRVPCIFV